jgi:hypothetical protein
MTGPRGETVGVDPAAPRPDVGFRIHVPDAWLTLDLDPATSDGWVERVLDARVAEHPEAARHRGHMRRILQSLVAEQRAAGVFLSAVLATGARPSDLIGANLSLTWAELTAPAEDVDRLAGYFATEPMLPGETPESRLVQTVGLPAGPAVRTRTSVLAPVPESTRGRRVALTQYVIPVPATRWLAVLVVSSPNLTLADAFHTLADEVARTLTFLDPAAEPAADGSAAPARRIGTIGYVPGS